MSRSRAPKCGCGRGCWVCGDDGEVRREREEDARRADEREDPDPQGTMLLDAALSRADSCPYCDTGCEICDSDLEDISDLSQPLRVPLVDAVRITWSQDKKAA